MKDRDLIFEQYRLIKEEEEPTMTVNSVGNRVWRLSNGELHRLDGPAYEYANGSKEWWVNGKRHRVDGPAIEFQDGYKAWLLNDKLHREDGPAIEYGNGTKEWWVNGNLHREDGPAIEGADGTKEWFLNGQRHREDGPAIEYANGYDSWYLNNTRYLGPRDWAEAVLKLHNKPHDEESIEEFLRDIYAKHAEDLL